MPIFDYKCNDCGKTYDVLHLGREIVDDVVCPSCKSMNHTRLISAPQVSTGKGLSEYVGGSDDCGTDSCCGGACGIN